ncbi:MULTISPECIES: hypothetical protein [Ureibacillus]|jgi:hypothetical protein|uniref:Uncharacterized protein n=1 Tax=Ureibacillus thermosphaericus TaxID=51173 RepID=A0A840PQ70_URETH|nr:hypothetical protein [Ureibacillus thermosphaericus]MBB5150565.1 hypothetical protein [Ureibacillus thermosphaericus]NKZ33154.1 hypothetical protein [Ureibacillus thermosphaericus]
MTGYRHYQRPGYHHRDGFSNFGYPFIGGFLGGLLGNVFYPQQFYYPPNYPYYPYYPYYPPFYPPFRRY